MKINTKQWKKVKADGSYTYFQDHHKNELKVAHTTLSPKLRADLAALPVHMADGGEIDEPEKLDVEKLPEEEAKDDEAIKDIELPAKAPEPLEIEALPQQPPVAAPVDLSAATTILQAEARDPAAQPAAPAASPPKDELAQSQDAQARQLTGLKMEADAISKQGAAEALAAHQSAAAEQQIAQHFQTDNQKLMDEQAAIMNDFKAGHIDPDKMWAERSTPGKIATIIGIIASGLSGQDSMAIKVLNQQIDRDIDAQKANLSQKGNVLNALSQQMGSVRAGAEMMKNMQLGIASSKMQEAAAKAKDPMAKARLEQNAGILQQQFIASNARISAQQTVDRLTQEFNKDPSKAAELIQATSKINPEAAKDMASRYIPDLGFASSPKAAEELREVKTTTDGAKWSIGELEKINKLDKLQKADPKVIARAATLSQGLVGLLRPSILGPGVVDKNERKILEGIAADPTKILSLSSSNLARYKTISEKLSQDLVFAARARGITNVQTDQQRDAQKQQAWDKWAAENPNDPRAKEFQRLKQR